jgi:hypothetical protein
MATRKRLAEIAILSVAMPATVFLCLWVLVGVLHVDRLLGVPEPELSLQDSGLAAIGIVPGEGHWLKMQRALIRKGYSILPADALGQDDTLTALEAFQDDSALPVQPKCDQQCWAALGL